MISTKEIEKNLLNTKRILAPVLLFCQLFGVIFYYWKVPKLFKILHRMLIIGIITVSLIHEIPSLKYWEKSSYGLHGFIVKLEAFTWWFCYYTNFLITSFKNEKINALIDSVQNSKVYLSSRSQVAIFRFNVVHIVVNFAFVFVYNILGHDFVWPNANHTRMTSTIYICGDLMISTCFYAFSQTVNLIGDIFKQINQSFQRIRKEYSSDSGSNVFGFHTAEIINLRQSHLSLTKICIEVNDCFSEQILLIIFFSMVQAIYAVRSIMGDFSINEVQESILNVLSDTLWLLPSLMTVIQLITFCEKTSTESKKTLTVVHHLMNLYYYDYETLRELELFALQIKQNPIAFNVRFFELHFPFLNTLTSSLMTYFVVIATFKGESMNGKLVRWNFKPETSNKSEIMAMKSSTKMS